MTKYLVAYSTPTPRGTLAGRAFTTTDRLTQDAIEGWERLIQDKIPGATHVTITNVIKLED